MRELIFGNVHNGNSLELQPLYTLIRIAAYFSIWAEGIYDRGSPTLCFRLGLKHNPRLRYVALHFT
jgi:hypothetical protein